MTIPRIILPLALAALVFPGAQLSTAQSTDAQSISTTPIAASASTAVPALVPFSGVALAADGKPMQSGTGITFMIFKEEQGGDELWSETQSVDVDSAGHYKVQLGAGSPNGLPAELFSTGEARWLETQIAGEKTQARVLLSSVPYALKAADAESLAGHAASDFVTQKQLAQLAQSPAFAGQSGQSANGVPEAQPNTSGTVTGSGTTGTVPLWTGALTQGNSEITQVGSDVGINEATPGATLDVGGTATFRGTTTLPAEATATTSAGYRSQLLDFTDSAWSTTTNAPVAQSWRIYATDSGNDTADPLSTLNFQFQNGAGAATPIVLSVAQTGVINFAPTQTFPGTIKSVTATSPVTATTTSGAVSLGLNTAALESTLNSTYAQLGAANTFSKPITFAAGQTFPGTGTGNGTITGVTAGTGLTGGGAAGAVTLNVDTTKVPLLASANTFTGATTLQGGVSLPALGSAEPGGPSYNSAPVTFTASAINSSGGPGNVVTPTFQWQAEPFDSGAIGGTAHLNLLTWDGQSDSALAESGLAIDTFGTILFSSSQTFPNTFTTITAGSGLVGGGSAKTSQTVTLSVDTTKVPLLASANTFTQPITFAAGQTFPGTSTLKSVSATSPLTAETLFGNANLSLNTTALETTLNSVYPRLAAANTFTAPITFAAGQTFPGTGTLNSVTAASPLTASTTGGVASLSLNTAVLESTLNGAYASLAGSNVFTGITQFNGGGLAATASGNTSVKIAVYGAGTTGDVGVEGTSDSSAGVWGTSTSGTGVYGVSGTGDAVAGTSTDGQGGSFTNNSSASAALYASNSASGDAIAIKGVTNGNFGEAIVGAATGNDAIGTWGSATGNGGIGLYGISTGTFDAFGSASVGVQGLAAQGIGVLGREAAASSSFNALETYGYSAGVWGDTGVAGNGVVVASVAGTADDNSAAYFYNKSAGFSTVVAYNEYPGSTGLFELVNASSPAGTCGIGGSGDLSCTGQLKSLVSASGGARKVETYAMQSPENWMEDFGSGELERGVAVVKLDPVFAETVAGDANYHVFITPNGDSKGLYVIRKTANSFEVRESGGGVSSLTFDYRIVAKRRGYEAQRLTDVTERFNAAMKSRDLYQTTSKHIPSGTGDHHPNPARPVAVPAMPPTPTALKLPQERNAAIH